MKPLELKVYPPAEKEPSPSDPNWLGWDDWRSWDRANTYEFHERARKRLSEAELCAEFESMRCDLMMLTFTGNYWSSPFDTCPTDEIAVRNRADTMLRFATSPHYFEEAA